jgi:hypothetical protein
MMKADHEILSNAEWDRAHRMIAAWKNQPDAGHECPRCERGGITIADHSARPYSEWYELNCTGCGLNVTMHIPFAPTPGASV